MAPPRANGSRKPISAIIHVNKRTNLPTADAQEFVAPEIEAPQTLLYPRRPELDPQLVWKGKDEQDRRELEVQAPPIYIQEKIDPRVLIENLRRTSSDTSDQPQLQLFEQFDGLGALELVEFYRHSANWSNRLILGDSLNVMASLAEREALRGQVQMVYIDPPYGIKFGSNWQVSVRDRDVKDGNLEDAAREVEQIKAFRDTWELGVHSYLSYLRDRLAVARDLLTASGSIFVQIGDDNVHLVRCVMDEVFGSENFQAQINFKSMGALGQAGLARTYDYLLWYSRDKAQAKFRPLYRGQTLVGDPEYRYVDDDGPEGGYRIVTSDEQQRVDQLSGIFRRSTLTSSGYTPSCTFDFDFAGRTFRPFSGKSWRTNEDGIQRLVAAGRIFVLGGNPYFKRYASDFPVIQLENSWTDPPPAFAKRYVVETASKFIERCMLMTTDPGDLVLDPTCGSGTTAVVSEQWGRRWITIDTSRVALALTRQRLMSALFPYYLLADSDAGRRKEQELTGTVLVGTPVTNDIRHGFVYDRVRHVTLKAIANNPDISSGMARDQIDAAVTKHAEYELLYDHPFEDRGRVRVTGPLTVESLSPHRSLAFAPASEPISVREAAQEPSAVSFEDTILANLGKAGIQNGRRHERLEFGAVDSYGGTYIQAIGTQQADGNVAGSRIAISIGPQYGTVGPPFIKAAAREAIRDDKIDLLCVLGFAFDPTALGTADEYNATADGFANVAAERSLGRVPVLLVRMNADLVMGEDLKKTGAGNLFTVFGEPDIEIAPLGDELTVEIKGVDVYDPTTGEVRSNDPGRIALWMIDTSYNGESFFVRHCYFTGGLDPYKRLKAALKADIDEESWASLYRTVSRPFRRPETGKIAVKVINDYGDEVLKVFEV